MKRINSYQAVASFVRGFFEAYARGIMDAAIGGDDFQKKNDPKEVKQMMLEHYGEVNQYFFDIMFSTLVRLNYKSAEEANERMKKNFESMKQADPTFEPTMLDYLRMEHMKAKMPDMTEAKISEEMHTIDRARKKFCSYYTNTEFGVADYYDICLNASALGIDNCIDVLYQLCK